MSWSKEVGPGSFKPQELVDRRERARRKSGATFELEAIADASKPETHKRRKRVST